MPLVTIWRDKNLVGDDNAIAIRDALLGIVQKALKVETGEVEIRIRDIGPLDINFMPVGIEIDTGTGKNRWRVEAKIKLAKIISEDLYKTKVIKRSWVGPDKSYVWIRICESSFVPIGFSHHAR